MRSLVQLFSRTSITNTTKASASLITASKKPFSTQDGNNGNKESDTLGWDTGSSSWSTGLTKEHFDGQAVGQMVPQSPVDPYTRTDMGPQSPVDPNTRTNMGPRFTNKEWIDVRKVMQIHDKRVKKEDAEREREEIERLLMQVEDPGARSSFLTSREKDEMYEKHKKDPELYTVEKLAKDYKIMRQRVHAILWLRELEEKAEKPKGDPLYYSSIDMLIDTFPEAFELHDREFHVATLPYKPDFKVMPEGWDGVTRDPDEVLYEISMEEDDIMYEEFVLRMNFNKMKMANMVKCHKYSRIRPSNGWKFTVEKLGAKDKCGNGGGFKFVSEGDGSSRPLNEFENMFLKRETPRRGKLRRMLP